jgi:hypothetical protein
MHQFLLSRLISFKQLSMGVFVSATLATVALIAELSHLNWPREWIVRSLLSIPRRHFSEYFRVLMFIAAGLAKQKMVPLTFTTLNNIFTNAMAQIALYANADPENSLTRCGRH